MFQEVRVCHRSSSFLLSPAAVKNAATARFYYRLLRLTAGNM
jgi:hypothetical protein